MLGGYPTVFGINPQESEANPSHELGTIGVSPDGRRFRYAKNNASSAAVAGELQQTAAEDTGDQALTVAAAAAVGATQVSVGAATVTANQYAGGYLVVTGAVGNGGGSYYKIKSHPAATAATVVVTLAEPVRVALNTSSTVDFVPNPYNGVIQNPTSATSAVAGVAIVAIPVSYYGWLQVGGPGVVKADGGGAVTVGAEISASNGTAGCVENGVAAQASIGIALSGIASGDFGLANLNIS